MNIYFKFGLNSTVIWKGCKCTIWGIYIHKDGTYEYHIKLNKDPKRGVFKVKESELMSVDSPSDKLLDSNKFNRRILSIN